MKNNYISSLHFISKHLFTLLVLGLLFIGAGSVSGKSTTWNKTNGGSWTSNGNWSNGVPVANDVVIINSNQSADITNVPTITLNSFNVSGNATLNGATSGNTLTVTTTFNVSANKTLIIGSSGGRLNFTLSTTATGTISGSSIVTMDPGTSNTYTFTNNGILNLDSNAIINGVSNFTLNSGASIITAHTQGLSTTAATGSIQVTGTKTYNTGANYTYNASGDQNIGNGVTGAKNLTLSGSGTKTLSGNITISNNLSVTAGTLNCDLYQITGNATGTMTMNPGTFLILGRTVTPYNNINFPSNFTNINLDPTSTVVFQSPAYQVIPSLTYGNLTLTSDGAANPGNTKVAQNNLTINGNLTISDNTKFELGSGTALTTMTIAKRLIVNGILYFTNWPIKTVTVMGDLSGTGVIDMTQLAHILNLNGQNNTIGTLTTDGNNSVVNYASAGNQQVFASPNYKSLTISGGGTKTFAGTTNISNTFTINNGVVANLGIGLTHTANAYYLGAALQYKGSWGSTGSNATYTNNTNFDVAASGILNTTTGACGPGYWVGASGALGTDWNTPSNWCDNKVPTASTNVYIPNVTYEPIIGTAGGLCKNITIETGSSLTQGDLKIGASNLFVYGNWTNNGTYTCGIGTTTFAGASAQTIGGNNSTFFYNLTIQNTGGVTLNKATTVTRTLLLISGVINTTATNLLSVTTALITNQDKSTTTAYGVIMGGSSRSYINGPVSWSFPPNLAAGSIYKFPVGNTTYLPYTLVVTGNNNTPPIVQVQAFNTNRTATVDGTLAEISKTEYWKSAITAGSFASTSVTLGKGDDSVYPYNVVAESTAPAGAYTSRGGTPGFYEVRNSSAPASLNDYFALGRINTATINISPIVLGGFGYVVNFGPSSEQTFTVNGTSLQESIVITAPTGYEISNTTGIGFVQTITLTRDGSNNVNNVTLYIRLKADLAVGTYNGNYINITSIGATPKTIECNGTVFATTPSIITSGGLNCASNEIDLFSSSSSPDINILYWNGPNNYYSQLRDLIIKPVTASMYGLYTVTGSIPTGANLIVNGDFSQGNTGFSSSYVFTPVRSNNQGIYNVTDNPTDMNTLFVVPATTGDKQLVIDGATTANVTVWSETVKVVPNSTYQFTYMLKGLYKVTAAPSIIQLYANNQAIGTPFTAVAPDGTDTKYYYNWYSGSSTSVTLDLRNQSTIGNGNDFALDDIDFRTVTQVSSSVNVPGNHTSAVSISSPTLNVPTGTANVTLGTNVTYTATSTNGGKAPTYVWTVTNGTNVVSYPSTSSATFNYVPVVGDVISCAMTASADNTCATLAISNSITMTFTGANYWIGAPGAGGTDWWEPTNWTANKVPAPGDNVEFATTTNNGSNGGAAKNHLYVHNNRIIGNLINNASGQNLIIPANTQLYVNNKITLDAVDPNAPYDQIQIKSDNTGVLPNGSLIFPNATNVQGSVEMYSKANISGDPNDPESSFFWQYFGIPVKSLDAVPTFYGAYVRRSNETGDESYTNYYWTEIGTYDKLTQFLGYELCQTAKTTYTFKGQLVNEDFDSDLLPISPPSAKYPGQHLFANSYTAAINIDKIQFGTDMDNTIYLYNTGSYGNWADPTINTSSGNAPGQYLSVPQNPSGSNGLTSQIPSMSSFLVKTGGNATVGSRVQISYKDAIVKNNTLQKVKAIDEITNTDLVSSKIDLIGQHYSDCMWIFSESSCTRNFDNGWDGKKILGSSLAPQIYAMEPDGDYQVNSVSDMHNTDLAFQAGDEVEYTLKFTHENIQQRYAGVYLVDLIENKTVDVSQNGSTYTFATAQSDAPAKRFKILTRAYEKGAPDKEAQVKIFTAPGRVFVHNLTTFKGECTLYDIAGRVIKNGPFAANAVTEVLNNLTPGAYVVNTITNGEKVSKRVIVQ